MRKSRFSEEQIVAIIQEYAAGAKVSELCRKHGMSDATFYKWKAKTTGPNFRDHFSLCTMNRSCPMANIALIRFNSRSLRQSRNNISSI